MSNAEQIRAMQAAAWPAIRGIIADQGEFSGLISLLPPALKGPGFIYRAYTYNSQLTPLGANAAGTATITVDTNCFFAIVFTNCIVTDVTNLIRLPFAPQTVLLTDVSGGNNLSQTAEHFENVFGDAQAPGMMNVPYYLKPGASLSATFQNLSATAANVSVSFKGFKIVPPRIDSVAL